MKKTKSKAGGKRKGAGRKGKFSEPTKSVSFKFEGYDLEDMARMVLNIHLSYMGDKAKYILGNKEWSNNFHR